MWVMKVFTACCRLLPALLLAGSLAGCVSDAKVIDQAEGVHKQLTPQVVTDAELDAYTQRVGDKIVLAAKEMYEAGELDDYDVEPWMFEDVQFHLVASPIPNAFTTGGKHVYLYTELFEGSSSEDAFAGVVGHEFGHIIGRHVHESMRNQQLSMIGAGAAGLVGAALAEDGKRMQTGATVGGIALVGGQMAGLSFGRNNEREADELGFEFYVRAGYDPKKFADFFKAMLSDQQEQGGGGDAGLQGFLSSHPQLSERVRTAEERAAAFPSAAAAEFEAPPVAPDREFAQLQRRSQPLTQAAANAARTKQSTAATEALAILSAFPACVGGLSDDIPPAEQAK